MRQTVRGSFVRGLLQRLPTRKSWRGYGAFLSAWHVNRSGRLLNVFFQRSWFNTQTLILRAEEETNHIDNENSSLPDLKTYTMAVEETLHQLQDRLAVLEEKMDEFEAEYTV